MGAMATTQSLTVERRRVIDAAVALAVGDIYDEVAFDRVVAAVKRVLRQEEGPVVAPRSPVVPFGVWRDKPIDVVPTHDLLGLSRYLTKAITQPAKADWKASNYALLAAVRAELQRREKDVEEVSTS